MKGRIQRKQVPFLKKVAFGGIMMLLTLLFLLLLEGILRLVGAGYSTEPFLKPSRMPQVYVDNPRFLQKYYSERKSFDSKKNYFVANKPKGTLRGFVVGGSTAEGYPYPSNQSFGKIAEVCLNTMMSNRHTEIINLGYSAMSSYYVSDVVKKLVRYQPDFIVVYSGHNEYYGTISATTGGSWWHKKVYLAMKELRLFQVLFGLMSPSVNENNRHTLMAERVSGKQINPDFRFDSRVTEDFIRNMDEVYRICQENHIKLFMIEPVCNLVDMPPFAGLNDEKYSPKILEMKSRVSKSRNWNEYFLSVSGDMVSNANYLYCDAMAREKFLGDSSLTNWLYAKDMDLIPFRAKQGMVKALRNYMQSRTNADMYYLNTEDRLYQAEGINGFGNKYFIDHLHFNFNGQLLLGKWLAEELISAYHIDKNLPEMSDSFNAMITQKLCLTEVSEVLPYLMIVALLKDKPYNDMVIPYSLPDLQILFPKNGLAISNRAWQIIREHPYLTASSFRQYIISNYVSENRFEEYYLELKSELWNNPANPDANFLMGVMLASSQPSRENPLYYLSVAYGMSDGKKEVFEVLEKYLNRTGQSALIPKFIQSMGKPRRY